MPNVQAMFDSLIEIDARGNAETGGDVGEHPPDSFLSLPIEAGDHIAGTGPFRRLESETMVWLEPGLEGPVLDLELDRSLGDRGQDLVEECRMVTPTEVELAELGP